MLTTQKTFAPLLAAPIKNETDLSKLQYPLFGSSKIDGIRTLLRGSAMSRKLLNLPNRHIQAMFHNALMQYPQLNGCDGEITLGDITEATHPNVFNRTQSAVMSFEGHPKFTYWVFDYIPPENEFGFYHTPYHERHSKLIDVVYEVSRAQREDEHTELGFNIVVVRQERIENRKELEDFEQQELGNGYEGIMLRSMTAKYKYGRSTLLQGTLMKLKRAEFMINSSTGKTENEAKIIGFEELMHNDNPLTRDNLGMAKRSTHKAGKRPGDTLGKLVVEAVNGEFSGVQFKIGTGNGLTFELRKHIWNNKQGYFGKYVTFSHQLSGSLDKPRFPVFERFRDAIDVIAEPPRQIS